MAGEDNLKPVRSVDEAREKGAKGGRASGKSRREKALLREAADLILSRKLPPGEHDALLEALGIPKSARTHALLATLGMVTEAESGNPAAFKRLMELRGEGLERQEVSVTNTGQLESLLEDRQRFREGGEG